MKKITLLTLLFMFALTVTSTAQFGIQSSIKKKYKKKYKNEGKKHADKGLDKAEDKGMEEADKGLDKATDAAEPGIQKAEEAEQQGEEYTLYGLNKYNEFVDDYEEDVENKDPADYKKYRFESAIVEYELDGSDEGTKTVYVDMGGYKMAEYATIRKKKSEEKEGHILIGADMITIDFENKSAVKMHNPMAYLLADPYRDWEKTAERILVKLGFEKTGKEDILGRECDIWKQGRHSLWVWDGLTLKSVDGKNTEVAVSVSIDEAVMPEVFEAPEGFEYEEISARDMFPDVSEGEIEDDEMSEEEMNQLLDEIETMSYSEYKYKVLEEEPNADEDEIKQAYLYLRQQAKRRHD